MKTKVNEIPLVGPKGRKELLKKVNELEKRIDSPSSDSESKSAVLTADDVLSLLAEKEYFTLEAVADLTTINWISDTDEDDDPRPRTIQVSTDKITWTDKASDESGVVLATLNAGEKLYIRGNNNGYGWTSDGDPGNSHFSCSKDVYAYGNIMSLINGENALFGDSEFKSGYGARAFYGFFTSLGAHLLFRTDKKLVLPSTEIPNYAYAYMFYGCSKIKTAPKISALKANSYCCMHMFDGCTSLMYGPELPATELQKYSYCSMFKNCTSLLRGPSVLPADTVTCCAYNTMFEGCTNLSQAPDILASTFEYASYEAPAGWMFENCSSLHRIKCLVTQCTDPYEQSGGEGVPPHTPFWLEGAGSYGTFIKHPNAKFWERSVNGIPENWTIETAVK